MLQYIGEKRRFLGVALSIIFFFAFVLYGIFFSPPQQFPVNDMVVIPKGVSVLGAGKILEERKVISFPSLFAISVKLFDSGDTVVAGGYLFSKKENLFVVVRRLTEGDHKLDTLRVTFPEGITVKEMARICKEILPLCDEAKFIEIAQPFEGYLYPDTYFFLQSTTAEEVVEIMKETFNQRFSKIEGEVRAFGKSKGDIIIMASILEKEAQNFENQKAVASILWKRMGIGMALQVDATLQYAIGKNTYQLTTEDLATTSPYNSYKNRGLPPTPISNPGIESIKATLSAQPTKYLFYLTDRSGRFYFAETHEKHVQNKQRYLNSF